jgi:radical SAM superfamily enzyme YgiQ (UPF0313 family)
MARILLIKCSDITKYRGLEYKHRNFLSMVCYKLIMETPLKRFTYAMVPPLGIMYIASVLRRAGHSVKILDLRTVEIKPFSLKTEIERFNPRIVGLSAITTEAQSLHQTAAVVKETIPEAIVIAGGPHASSYPEKVLMDNNIQACVLGEGEETAVELIDSILNGEDTDLEKVKGIAFRKNGEIIFTQPREYIKNLDTLPFPSWDLIDFTPYSKTRSMASVGLRKYMSLFTSRACPYRCIYCHNMFGKGFRARSPSNVLDEIDMLNREYGIKEFEILDDIFNADKERARTIFKKIAVLEKNLKFAFPNGLRTDILDYETLRIFKEGGVHFTAIAVESASNRIQKLIKKNLNLEKVMENISICADLRIFTRGYFMFGFPTETREEVMETINFAVKSKLHSAMFFIVTPFQGTELEKNFVNKIDGVPYDLHDYFLTTFNLSKCEDMELFLLQENAIQRFNQSLKRQLMMLRDLPRRRHIWIYGIGIIATWAINTPYRETLLEEKKRALMNR